MLKTYLVRVSPVRGAVRLEICVSAIIREPHVQSRYTPSNCRSVFSQLPLSQCALSVLVAVIAVMIGNAIAEEKWLYCVAALFIAVTFVYPIQVAVGLFAFLVPFDSIAVIGEATHGRTLTWLAGAAAGMILFAAGFAARRLKPPPAASIWWISFTLWCAVTAVWALNPQSSWQQLPTACALLGLYIACGCVRFTKRELQSIIILSILGGCVAAIWTIYLYSQGDPAARASLTLGSRDTNPNDFGMSLLLPISLAFGYFLWCRSWLRKSIILLAIGVTTLGLLITMSRGAVVALVVMLLVYLYRLRAGSRLIVPVVLLAVLLAFMPSVFFARFQEASQSGGSGRLGIWKVGLAALKHYGLFGAGFANFPFAYTNYASEAPQFMGFYRDPHNIYLRVAVETGLIGLLLFAGAVRVQLRTASRFKNDFSVNNSLMATVAAAWGMLAFGLFGNILWDKGFWLAWMLLAAAESASEDSSHSIVPPLRHSS
jgi:O-antigen ligase